MLKHSLKNFTDANTRLCRDIRLKERRSSFREFYFRTKIRNWEIELLPKEYSQCILFPHEVLRLLLPNRTVKLIVWRLLLFVSTIFIVWRQFDIGRQNLWPFESTPTFNSDPVDLSWFNQFIIWKLIFKRT